MAEKLDHLELPLWRDSARVRPRVGGIRTKRSDKQEHGKEILRQIDTLQQTFQRESAHAPQGINPKLIFKVKLVSQGYLDDDAFRRLNLNLLARTPERAVVVFPNDEALAELRRRLSEYSGLVEDGNQYHELGSIESIEPLGPEDRIGPRLEARPLSPEEADYLDIELWHPGPVAEARQLVDEFRNALPQLGSRVTDQYVGQGICLVRAFVTYDALQDIASNIDYVRQIERRPQPTFELVEVFRLGIDNLETVTVDPRDLVGILILDSGVSQGHPLIGPVLGDAQVFPDRLRVRVLGGPEDGDERTGGHGTSVAGIAVYGDVREGIASRRFRPTAALFSARITDENNEYDDESLLEHQFEEALQYFLSSYPTVRVVNVSLGSSSSVYSEGSHQFRFAAIIDELAYRYRDREIVFVVSAGNLLSDHLPGEDLLEKYPDYLIDDARSRIIDPATAALAITVGGLSLGYGRVANQIREEYVDKLVAGEEGWPSPFTRTGFGVDGAIKPEVVEVAGDWRFHDGKILNGPPQYAGLPSTSRDFAPPDGSLFRTVAGTSFAAPKVANLAAKLMSDFPEATSNMIRALIADSARTPQSRPNSLRDLRPWSSEMLQIYGFGQPDYERARWSSSNQVLLVHQGLINIDTFQVFQIPPLPEEFIRARGKGFISVTLAFDPPTRHTRADSYLGTRMTSHVFKNSSPEAVVMAFTRLDELGQSALETDEGPPTLKGLNEIKLYPSATLRSKGTLQRGVASVSNASWRYDNSPLTLVVTCRRKWAPIDVEQQRFALVVAVWHENPEVNLYDRIRQHTRVQERVRIRA